MVDEKAACKPVDDSRQRHTEGELLQAYRVALNTATSAATSAALRAAIFSRRACKAKKA